MKNTTSVIIAPLLMVLSATAVFAQMIAVRDEITVDVPQGFFHSEPSPELKQEARKKAGERAWRRYQAENVSGARASLFAQHKDALLQRAEELCSFTFYEERFDKDALKFAVKVRGSCDQKAIDAYVSSLAGGKAAQGMGGAKASTITFMFLARRAADATIFTDKVTRETSSTVSTVGSESSNEAVQMSRDRGDSEATDISSVTQTARTVAKEKTQQRDTVYKYKVEQSEGVDNAVTNVLTTSGYEVSKYADLIAECPGVNLDEVVITFASPEANQAELISSALRGRMIKSAKACEMDYFAVGLLDILKSERMPDGTERVTVALTIDVRDIRKRIPIAAAAIPAVQYQALGRDRIEAANSALTLAAEKGTREIVDMLRQRGVQ